MIGRPREEAALFNPAFLAVLLRAAAREHGLRGDGAALPVPFAFVIPALALHAPTRNELPHSVAAQMAVWVQSNPSLVADLPTRTTSLRPLVSDACVLGLRHGVLRATERGLTEGTLLRRRRGTPPDTDDMQACIDAAAFLGRWFADQPDALTALAMWGLRP